jgi:putative redox protein
VRATVTLDRGMTFTGTANSGFPVKMDASSAAGGDDSAVRPMELFIIGLGGCTGMDVISILRKKRQDVTGFEVKLDAKQAKGHPHVFTRITVHYIIRGKNVDPKAVARSIELSQTKYCPAQAILGATAEIEHTYEIIEDES